MENREALEAVMTAWCAERTQAEVMEAFTAAEAAIGPVMSMADIAADPHYAAREAIVEVDGTPMQGLIAHLSATPGALRGKDVGSTPTATRSEPRAGATTRISHER